ncbi:MAG: hypothetical protein HY735_28870 [Verrucomicrobia bacterium]|nr:hypothetical protein [Verrucomicrobiota bacterium]
MRRCVMFVPSVCLFLIAACETRPPTPSAPVASIDYGPYPQNFEQIVKDHFAKSLLEPASAQYRFGRPFAGYTVAGPLLGGKVQEAGYFVEIWLKAKDRTGGYLPEQRLGVLIKNGEVLMELREMELEKVKRAPASRGP